MVSGRVENTTIADLHRQLVQELHGIEDEIYELEQRQERLSSLVEELESLYDELPRYSNSSPNGGEQLRGQEAVERALKDADGWMSVKEITTELQLHRWIDRDSRDPEAAVRASLRRLAESEDSELEQKKEGRSVFYRIRAAS